MKKLMNLGGNYFQMTLVKRAKEMGVYVIDVDYLPDNPAHKYADEYHNISIADKEKVLELAQALQIDGIVSYASDVGAPTAAYVAEKMGLPTNPFDAVMLMVHKHLFHPFLKENGFYGPRIQEIISEDELIKFFESVQGDIIVKPVDSSGSKGVCRVSSNEQISQAYAEALKYSRGEKVVAEEFIQRKGYQIAGDAFVVNGIIKVFGLANEHFDEQCNPLVPIGESFPVKLSETEIQAARDEIQRAITVLGIKNGAINLDFMFTTSGDIFIIELGPRNGGNLITDTIMCSSGMDLAEYTIKSALGEDISTLSERPMKKCVSSYIWHSCYDGIFESIEISDELQRKIVRSDLFVEAGDRVCRFENAGFGLGAAILEFDSEEEMLYMMAHMNEFFKIKYS